MELISGFWTLALYCCKSQKFEALSLTQKGVNKHVYRGDVLSSKTQSNQSLLKGGNCLNLNFPAPCLANMTPIQTLFRGLTGPTSNQLTGFAKMVNFYPWLHSTHSSPPPYQRKGIVRLMKKGGEVNLN